MQFGMLGDDGHYATLTDGELDDLVRNIRSEIPQRCGIGSVQVLDLDNYFKV